MKQPIILFVSLIMLLCGCKKTIEKKAEDIVIQAMTNGQWVVTKFIQNGTDITSSFSSYKFQYYSNKTVDAIKNGITENTGTWNGDASAMTIEAYFLGASAPISLINGTWNITKNSWTYVEATQNGTEVKNIRLEKQ